MELSARLVAFLLLSISLSLTGCDSSGPNSSGEETGPATVQFADPGATASESTTATIAVEIVDAGNETVNVDIVFDAEASEASSDDVEGFSSESVSFPAGAEDRATRDVNVPITLDDESEDTETATFTLQNTTGDAEISSPETFDLEIEDRDEEFTPVEVVDLDCPAELETGEEGTFVATINEDEATTPVSSDWEFGDGTTATGVEVTKTYDAEDSYTVTFTASNDGSEDSANCSVEVSEAGASGVIYVDADATGNDNGSTWENAYIHLQDALRNAESGTEIWVAEGTYFPDWDGEQTTGNREDSFQMKSGVGLYGGFSGGETERDQRDWEENKTTLSGEIGISDFEDDNSCHVVRGGGVDNTATLDGFTVVEGNSDESCSSYDGEFGTGGSGMLIDKGSPVIRNTTFTGNYDGGIRSEGDFDDGESYGPTIIACIFVENSGDGMTNIGSELDILVSQTTFLNNEGAIANSASNLDITASIINENSGGLYGAIFNDGGNVSIDNSRFSSNSGDSAGGILNRGDGTLFINRTKLANNSSTEIFPGGGSMKNEQGDVDIINSMFTGNSASNGSSVFGEVRIINSTFIGSTGSDEGRAVSGNGEIFSSILWDKTEDNVSQIEGDFFVRSSLVQGGIPENAEDGGGNINTNPLFVDVDGPDYTPGTLDDNLRLESDSPAIDSGTNEALDLDGDGSVTDDIPTDLEGDTRIQNGTVDMGAYEW